MDDNLHLSNWLPEERCQSLVLQSHAICHFLIVKSKTWHWSDLSAFFMCVFSKMLGVLGTLTWVTLLILLGDISDLGPYSPPCKRLSFGPLAASASWNPDLSQFLLVKLHIPPRNPDLTQLREVRILSAMKNIEFRAMIFWLSTKCHCLLWSFLEL